jgi:hypothetical protein
MFAKEDSMIPLRPLLAALAVLGCGTMVSYSQINGLPRPLTPKAPEEVEVFMSSPPSRPHVDDALIEAEQGSDEMPTMLHALRNSAAQRGCDAVYISGNANRDRAPRKTIIATCVVYTDVTEGTAAPPAATAATQSVAQAKPGVACGVIAGPPLAYTCPGMLVCREGICVDDGSNAPSPAQSAPNTDDWTDAR